MQKRNQSLKLNRETVRSLDVADALRVRGGLLQGSAFKCTGCDSGCGFFPDPELA